MIVPIWFELTVDTVALNLTLLSPAGTVMDAGTLMAAMLLERATKSPPEGAAALVVSVHVSLTAPVTVVVSQLRPLSKAFCAEPLPCSFTVAAGVEEEVAITLN